MDTNDLLRRWAECEPDRCIYDADYNQGCGIGEEVYDLHFREPLTAMDDHVRCIHSVTVLLGDVDRLDLALLQAAVQEAVEARGWNWQLWSQRSRKNYRAEVYMADDDYLQLDPDAADEADTAATALLLAYVAALEALQPEAASRER